MKSPFPQFLLLLVLCFPLMAQEDDSFPEEQTLRNLSDQSDRFYFTSGGEFIFSFADVEYRGNDDGSILRFAPILNIQSYFNYDPNDYLGFFAGFAVRNVGFIYDLPDSDIRKKYRTYNFGIPVGLKLGRMNRTFLYGGYELELPFHYKEKTFVDGDKEDKFTVWFGNRTAPVMNSIFVGIQFPYAANLKFKYYLTGFFNQDFRTTDANGQTVFPYADIQANVFYIALSFNILRDKNFTFDVDF